MSDSYSLLILPGDGIGPEVMAEVVKVIDWFGANRGMSFDISEGLVGGACYDAHQVSITDETMAKAEACDAVIFGAVGGPNDTAFQRWTCNSNRANFGSSSAACTAAPTT